MKKKVIMHRPNIAFVVPVFRYISTVTELERGKQAPRKCKNSILKMGPNFEIDSNDITQTVLQGLQLFVLELLVVKM